MTNKKFLKIIRKYIEEGDSHINKSHDFLLDFKNSGGKQETAEKLLKELALELSGNETLQDRVYDILDIITGWCRPEMRIWE